MPYQLRRRSFFRDSTLPRLIIGPSLWSTSSYFSPLPLTHQQPSQPCSLPLDTSSSSAIANSLIFIFQTHVAIHFSLAVSSSSQLKHLRHSLTIFNNTTILFSIIQSLATLPIDFTVISNVFLLNTLGRFPLGHYRVPDVRMRAQKYTLLLIYFALIFQAKLYIDRVSLIGYPEEAESVKKKSNKYEAVPPAFRILNISKGERPIRSHLSRHQ